MPTNDFVPWAIGVGANTLSPAAYIANTTRQQGVQTGIASSIIYNTALRQASSVSAMIGQFIADHQEVNVTDTGEIATLEAMFVAALQRIASSLDFLPHHFVGTDTGAADVVQVNDCYPAVAAYGTRCIYDVFIGFDNLTTNPHFQIAGLGLKPIRRADQTSCQPFDLQSGAWVSLADAGSYMEVVGLYGDFVPGSLGQTYLNSTVLVIPDGIHKIKQVRCWGGGAGGGMANGTNLSSFGGGGGGYSEKYAVAVTPGEHINITIGSGGGGGHVGSTSGSNGGTTTFGSAIPVWATGGTGGGDEGSGVQGTGGGGFGGQITANGHFGSFPIHIAGNACGGLGGAAPFSTGVFPLQAAPNLGVNGGKGEFPGGGANGACTGPAGGTFNGGDGGDGLCIVVW